jgi:hypothetical protein
MLASSVRLCSVIRFKTLEWFLVCWQIAHYSYMSSHMAFSRKYGTFWYHPASSKLWNLTTLSFVNFQKNLLARLGIFSHVKLACSACCVLDIGCRFSVNNSWKNRSKHGRARTREEHDEHSVSRLLADRPRHPSGLSAMSGQSNPTTNSQAPPPICPFFSQTALWKDLGDMWGVPRGRYAPKLESSNELNRRESNCNRARPKT